MNTTNVIERAFDLARAGGCDTVAELERKLKAEGFENVAAYLDSPSLRRQLKKLLLSSSREGVVVG